MVPSAVQEIHHTLSAAFPYSTRNHVLTSLWSMKGASPNTCFTNERGKRATELKRRVSACRKQLLAGLAVLVYTA